MNGHPLKTASRRRFLRTAAAAAATIPLVNLLGCSEEPGPEAPAESDAATAPPPPEPTTSPVPPAPADAGATAPQASGGEKLQESDPTAQALGYRHSADAVDPAEYPRFEPGQACANCSLYLAGQSSDPGWGGCSLFPGKLVDAQGWCNAYVAKA